jgi:hypothetical protein
MTGLEPHPIFRLPSKEEALAMGPDRFELLRRERQRRMELERDDPLHHGFEPGIWHVVDDLLCDGKTVTIVDPNGVDVPREMRGALELLLTGSNRATKSEYCGKKCMKVLADVDDARTWSFAETGPISIARQQPLFWKYLPNEVKRLAAGTGKAKQGAVLNIAYTKKNGFTEQTFVLPNGAQHWFKNYAQDIENVEGDQLDAVWCDEGAKPELVKTLRFRLGDRGGILLVSFTPIDDSYTAIVNEYDKGARTVLEVPAELLPLKDENGRETGRFEKVPRVKVAGPGSDGNQRANIVYFHITDNPYFGFSGRPKPGETPTFGKDRFYKMLRGATRAKILARAYGVATRAAGNQFPKFSEGIHVLEPDRIPRIGTNFHVVDPCPGRNWFMIWIRIDRAGRKYVYREWPSYGHPGAYIPGIGDPGPWTLPGGRKAQGWIAYVGERGPAQIPFGWGLSRYKEEILRVEGNGVPVLAESSETKHIERDLKDSSGEARESTNVSVVTPVEGATGNGSRSSHSRGAVPNPLAGKREPAYAEGYGVVRPVAKATGEKIDERWMDSRYGASPTQSKERITTLIEQMAEEDMEFLAASGKEIGEGVALINDALDYDGEVGLGEYSPALSRVNAPSLFVSRDCPNVIYALREWTGKDGQHGACKDPVDVLRYAVLEDLDYIGEDAFAWSGGGSY